MLGIFPAKWRIVRIDFGNGFFSVSIAEGKKIWKLGISRYFSLIW